MPLYWCCLCCCFHGCVVEILSGEEKSSWAFSGMARSLILATVFLRLCSPSIVFLLFGRVCEADPISMRLCDLAPPAPVAKDPRGLRVTWLLLPVRSAEETDLSQQAPTLLLFLTLLLVLMLLLPPNLTSSWVCALVKMPEEDNNEDAEDDIDVLTSSEL